jgi:hypothetical protein
MGLVYEMESESVPGPRPLVYVSMGADPDSLGRLDAALGAVLGSGRPGPHGRGRGRLPLLRPRRGDGPPGRSGSRRAPLDDGASTRRGPSLPTLRAARAAALTLENVSAAARRMLDPARRLTVIVRRAAAGAEPTASK